MEINKTLNGSVTIVAVAGSLDALTAPELTEAFGAEIGAGRVHLVADLAGLDYSSSAGLRVLLDTVKQARLGGGDLRLAAVQPKVMKVLDMSGFTSILKIFPDVAAAAASYVA